ncbi:hypothetical protein [Neptuniibacter halophilus]|uniref:hypothetical protein n=1 Tax=Neptuniibacter halophilus TaxID=651666 RepID=UPI0025731DE7|nr:hypothetical protein [Neptuniibacter halophilus]
MAGQVWETDVLGGYMYSDELSDTLRQALQPNCRFRQACDIEEGKGLNAGDKLYWNVYSDVKEAGGELDENTAMPETNYEIRQESMTVTEYGNSVPYTGKLDNLSKHPVEKIIKKVMKNDARKVLDGAAHAQFNATPLRVAPTGGNNASAVTVETGGTSSITNDIAMSKEHIKSIVDEMKERDIIPFDGDNYCSIGRPSTFRNFKNELETIHQYVEAGFGMIMNGEIGRYEGCRFIEQTNVGSSSWSNGKSDAAYFFGGDTVCEGIVIPEEVRGKIPTDYGRSKGVAWYFLGGFGISHTDPAQARILKWDSAA